MSRALGASWWRGGRACSAQLLCVLFNDIVRGGETNYISATLTLYVSIYNIFTSLLQILGIVDRD